MTSDAVAGSAVEWRRITMPQDWRALFGGARTTAVFRRAFHQPTGLHPGDVVALVFSGIRGQGRICLNESPLINFTSETTEIRVVVTPHLRIRNRLQVEICPIGIRTGRESGSAAVNAKLDEPGEWATEFSQGLYGVVLLEIVPAASQGML